MGSEQLAELWVPMQLKCDACLELSKILVSDQRDKNTEIEAYKHM